MGKDAQRIDYLSEWIEAALKAAKVANARMKDESKPKKKQARKFRRKNNA